MLRGFFYLCCPFPKFNYDFRIAVQLVLTLLSSFSNNTTCVITYSHHEFAMLRGIFLFTVSCPFPKFNYYFRIAVRPSIFDDSTGFLFFCQALAEIQPTLFGREAHYCLAYS